MRREPSACMAATAAAIGFVHGMPGRSSWTLAAILSSPITIAPEVQAKAMTSIRSPGRISFVA
jgi:hypothetical protein